MVGLEMIFGGSKGYNSIRIVENKSWKNRSSILIISCVRK